MLYFILVFGIQFETLWACRYGLETLNGYVSYAIHAKCLVYNSL